MILRFRQVNKIIFESIKSGVKRVETRAATKRYQEIKVGDEITFICSSDQFKKKVKHVKHFDNVEDLVGVYSVKEIIPSISTVEELKSSYKSFHGYEEKIKKFGLVAIELV